VIESFCDHFYDLNSSEQPFLYKIGISCLAKYARTLLIGLILCSSHFGTFSITNGYSAPLEIYKHFDHHDDAGTGATNEPLTSCLFLVLDSDYVLTILSCNNARSTMDTT
ncbi:hypothetical protein Tco_0667006, partial [Tanacetum coccineum]